MVAKMLMLENWLYVWQKYILLRSRTFYRSKDNTPICAARFEVALGIAEKCADNSATARCQSNESKKQMLLDWFETKLKKEAIYLIVTLEVNTLQDVDEESVPLCIRTCVCSMTKVVAQYVG